MTQVRIPQFLSKTLVPQTIGFDDIFGALSNLSEPVKSFPPYDIIRNTDNNWTVNIAVAGFTKEQLSVELEANQLRVTGEQTASSEEPAADYIYKGISSRRFSRSWTVSEGTKVIHASYENGILSINLERETIEKKVSKITIK